MAQVYQFVDDNGVTRLLAEITPEPAGTFNGGTITTPLTIDTSGATVASDNFGDLNVTGKTGNTAQVHVASTANSNSGTLDSTAGLSIISDSGLIELQDTSGNITFRALAGVKVALNLVAAPGTGNLAAGELALWFDQTDGAAKLMVQAKTADGTLVQGSLALAP